jgi:hypothetical protein
MLHFQKLYQKLSDQVLANLTKKSLWKTNVPKRNYPGFVENKFLWKTCVPNLLKTPHIGRGVTLYSITFFTKTFLGEKANTRSPGVWRRKILIT